MSAASPQTSQPLHASSGLLRGFEWALAAVLAVLVVAFVALTRHWPMVGDAALLHYSVFLIEHGWVPYRDLPDINMPGAYWATAAAMKLPGQPDVAWRIFDLGLVALAGCGYYVIARPYSRFAALFATAMLLLVHGQDGVQQAGQRDLAIAVLLILGSAALIEGCGASSGPMRRRGYGKEHRHYLGISGAHFAQQCCRISISPEAAFKASALITL